MCLANYMGCFKEFYESLSMYLLDENVFQNPQLFCQTIRLSPLQSTLAPPSPLNTREKTLGASEKLEDFETRFRIKWCSRIIKFHEAPYIAAQLYGVPHCRS
jgi:hypothetical protein